MEHYELHEMEIIEFQENEYIIASNGLTASRAVMFEWIQPDDD